jgi:hypothetical protein
MDNLTYTFAANVTYGSLTYNTPVKVEYKHTGLRYIDRRKSKLERYTENKSLADERYTKGYKTLSGYYFIYRLAIPDGQGGWWYINNEGDTYSLNKVSKAWQREHERLSMETVITD